MIAKLTTAALALFSCSLALADGPAPVIPIGQYPSLNIVHYQASVEQWVTTQTALVTMGVDASLNQSGMDNIQSQVNASLKKLADNVNWQMTTYERNQDASGLEKLHIEEQARLTSNQLTNIRTSTDKLSQPGVKYSIIDIQFTPSLAEMQAVNDSLRAQLYDKIKQEVNLLNKTYDQKFYVNDVEFYSGDIQPLQSNNTNGYKTMALAAAPAPQPAATMSQRLVMSADVTLASTIAAK